MPSNEPPDSHSGHPAKLVWGIRAQTTERGGTVRLVRCLARSAPNKTDADGGYVITVVGIVIGSLQRVEKPFITVAQAQIGLVR